MKNLVKHMILLLLLAAGFSAEAAIWRVNPDPASGAPFASLQDALNDLAVLDGDEIHVESNSDAVTGGTAFPHSAFINKQLNIYGPGYLLLENFPEYEDLGEALCDLIEFAPGSEGSIISGLSIANLQINAANITVQHCNIEATTINAVVGGTFFANFMQGVTPFVPVVQLNGATSMEFLNNIILHDPAFTSGQNAILEIPPANGNEYNHCVIGNANSQVFGAFVHNCIFTSHTFDDIQGSDFSNNIFELGFSPVAPFNPLGSPNDDGPIVNTTSNQLNVDLNTVFILPVAGGFVEAQYDIVPGSSAAGASDDLPPDNIGAFTVDIPGYEPSGWAATPIVLDLTPSAFTDTYLLPVTYSATTTDGLLPLVQAEYFFDNDPGFGVANAITFTPTLSIDEAFFSADISGLTDGAHVIGIRVLDASGQWSLVEFDTFVKEGLSALPSLDFLKYEFDDATVFTAPVDVDNPLDGDTEGFFVETLDLSGLPEGIHTIRVRMEDEFGVQGVTYTTTILVLPDPLPPPDLQQIEYFLDIDPGFGQAQQLPVAAGLNLVDEDFTFLFDAPTLGPHTLWVRFKDVEGHWSVAHVKQIHIVDDVFEALDADNDCDIDINDLLLLLAQYGCTEDPGDATVQCSMDANGDGIVDISDLLLFLALYGQTCDSQFPGGPDGPDGGVPQN